MIMQTYEANEIHQAVWPINNLVLKNLPHNHTVNIEWKNLADFPELKDGTKFVFKVISNKTYKIPGQNRWNNELVCKILEIVA